MQKLTFTGNCDDCPKMGPIPFFYRIIAKYQEGKAARGNRDCCILPGKQNEAH